MEEYKQIRYWVDALPRKGRNTFSLSEVIDEFPGKSKSQIRSAISRLITSQKIISVWRGYYAIVLPEYGEKRIVPPIEYIDHLLRHLGKEYYVATLSAAALHGAAHQKPLAFTFVCNKILHTKENNNVRLIPLLKNNIPYEYIEKRNVNSGTINISSPLLTAIDFMLYPQKSGGYGNIATVLGELAELISMEELDKGILDFVPGSVVQRLGYLFDVVLEEHILADAILEKATDASIKFRKTPLAYYRSISSSDCLNVKWKIIVNEEVETDL